MDTDTVSNWNQETLTRFILEVIRNNPLQFGRAFKADHIEATTSLVLNGQSVAGSFYITGQVDTAGNVVSGSGFSVNRSGTGIYDVTFTSPFSAPPTCWACATSGDRMVTVTSTVSTCQFRWVNSSVVLSNNGFHFAAFTTI